MPLFSNNKPAPAEANINDPTLRTPIGISKIIATVACCRKVVPIQSKKVHGFSRSGWNKAALTARLTLSAPITHFRRGFWIVNLAKSLVSRAKTAKVWHLNNLRPQRAAKKEWKCQTVWSSLRWTIFLLCKLPACLCSPPRPVTNQNASCS